MNARVASNANIWSPNAKHYIREQVCMENSKMNIANNFYLHNAFTLWQGIRYHESCLKEVGFKQPNKNNTEPNKNNTEHIDKNHTKMSKGSLTLFCVVLLFTLHCV